MKLLTDVIKDAFAANAAKYETATKDELFHKRKDFDLIVQGLADLCKQMTPGETRAAAIIIATNYGKDLGEDVLLQLQEIAFGLSNEDLYRLRVRVDAVMRRCSEQPTHQEKPNPVASLLDLLLGVDRKKEEKVQ